VRDAQRCEVGEGDGKVKVKLDEAGLDGGCCLARQVLYEIEVSSCAKKR
jgi:hypothetical protein